MPNAVSSQFRPIDRQVAAGIIERKFELRGPFVLTVGDLQPRKNHLGLLKAFEEVLRAHPQLKHDLVFVGKETWYSKELHRAVERSSVRGRVHFTGFVEDADLVHFYGACDLFAFPSFYEGFGLPILEAMACGRAVVCSNTTAMPEVANAAGILFDPHSTSEMVRAIGDVLLDQELRARLERLGMHRAALFSWEKAAARTLDVYIQSGRGQEGRRREKEIQGCGSRSCIMKYTIFLFLLVPVSAESLHYVINWPSGLSLGEATITFGSQAAGSGPVSAVGWSSDFEIDASLPGFAITDKYHSTAEGHDMCSVKLDKTVHRGSHESGETDTFHQDTHTVTRETHGTGGGTSDEDVSACARDALTFLEFARNELAAGASGASTIGGIGGRL